MITQDQPVSTASKPDILPSETYVPKAMPAVLGTLDMTAIYVVALFFIPNVALTALGGTVSLTYLVLGALVFFVPSVIATAQLGVLFPHEGSLYNWTYHALGSYWSFFIGICYWVSGIIVIVSSSNAFVAILQGLNSTWLTEPWQQGLVMLGLLILIAAIGMQRIRMTQNVLNVVFAITLLIVILMVFAVIGWLITGHTVQTSFSQLGDWAINPSNFSLFGLTTLNFIGASGPLSMAGELRGRGERGGHKVVTQHLLWGTLLVIACYALGTFAILAVRGQAIYNDPVPQYEVVTTVRTVLGTVPGIFVAVGLLLYIIWETVIYAHISSRLLLAAAIDGRLLASLGRFNQNRIPANAIRLQVGVAAAFVLLIFIVGPLVIKLGITANLLAVETLEVNSAALLLIWTIATSFLFINIVGIYRRDPQGFQRARILPMPLIWASVVLGALACVATIVGTILYSWIPQIPNGTWWYLVSGLAVVFLIGAASWSMIVSSEADWEQANR